MKTIKDSINNLAEKLEFQPNKQYLPAVWPPDMSRGDGKNSLCANCGYPYDYYESNAGQHHLFCSTRCEKQHYKIEAYLER